MTDFHFQALLEANALNNYINMLPVGVVLDISDDESYPLSAASTLKKGNEFQRYSISVLNNATEINYLKLQNKQKRNEKVSKNRKVQVILEKKPESIETLRSRLHEKIEHLRSKRAKTKTETDHKTPGHISIEHNRMVIGNTDKTHLSDQKGNKLRKINTAIKTLQSEGEMLSSLPDEEKIHLEKKILLNRALMKASGESVKDNLSKLVKSKKRIESKKKKSVEKWAERLKNQNSLTIKNKSGKSHIDYQSKKTEKSATSSRPSQKKINREGFEGRRSGFLNN